MTTLPLRHLIAAALTSLGAAHLAAEVVDSAAAGFTVRDTLTVKTAPNVVYRNIVGHVGDWWDSKHTFSGDAGNLTIDEKPGGCFCEKLPDGDGAKLTVTYAVGGYSPAGLNAMAGPVDSVLGEMFHCLKTYVETGNPVEVAK